MYLIPVQDLYCSTNRLSIYKNKKRLYFPCFRFKIFSCLISLPELLSNVLTFVYTLWLYVGSAIGSNGHPKVSLDVPLIWLVLTLQLLMPSIEFL